MRVFRRALLFGSTLVLLALPFVVFVKAQAITDWWQLRNYTPPSSVVSLAAQDSMTDQAQHIFYVNHPALESDTSQFRSDCNQNEKTIILGCYHSNQNGIFVYRVQDPRLAGVQQVTSAHEMLHAAYDRLSSKDRSYIDGLLQDYYDSGLKDPRIIDSINLYKQSEPNDIVNEMHSIFGTEVVNLPAPLEQYYQRYFTNRSAVTAFANNYESEFTTLENQIKADKAELDIQKSAIETQKQELDSQYQQINRDRTRLDALRRSGQIDQYNSVVAAFNIEVDNYNSTVLLLRQKINDYNQLVAQYNATAKELASLDQAIDTRVPTQASQ